MYWVYVIKCVDEGFYIGCTNNLRERFEAHKNGLVKATKYRLPVILYECFGFNNKSTAFNFEKYLKSGSGRAFAKKHFRVVVTE